MSIAGKLAALLGSSGTISTVAGGSPTGAVTPFAGASAPDGWLFCFGQVVSRSTYAALFAALGTAYGAGDGSTTFSLPDFRGRVPGGKDDMGGTAAGRLAVVLTGTKSSTSNGNITGLSNTAGLAVGMRAFGSGIGANATISAITSPSAVTLSANSTSTGSTSIRFAVVDGVTLGAVGGDHVHTLAAGQMPAHTHSVTAASLGSGGSYADSGSGSIGNTSLATDSIGGGQAHLNVQPTLVVNYLIKT